MIRILLYTIVFLSINSFGQKANEFKEGCYYDLEGNKIEGLIYYGFDHRKEIQFKENLQSNKTKIGVEDINAFVIEADSFTVLENFKFEGIAGGLNRIKKDFVKVLEIGKINLYEHYSAQGNPKIFYNPGARSFSLLNHIVAGENIEGYITIRRKTKYLFDEQMYYLLRDDQELLKEVIYNQMTAEDIQEIVKKFNE